jgi:aminoglycoside phosphotransferase (APT) family kinase protein
MDTTQPPIAVGRTAEIYPYADGKILKLFLPTVPQAWIDKEIEIGRYIQEARLPVPKVYEVARMNDRVGIVYERIEGPSLLNELAAKPWNVIRYGRLLAKLHLQVHEVRAPADLETQRVWATGGIPASARLSKDIKDRILELLESLPEGNVLCHGDFHPGNIIITPSGPVIIDWMTVSKGVASGDIARTLTILEVGKAPEGTPLRWLLEWMRKIFLSSYRNTILQTRPDVKDTLSGWQAVMAANFLSDVSIPEEEGDLMAIVARCLLESGS